MFVGRRAARAAHSRGAPRLLVLNKEDATLAIVDPGVGHGARHACRPARGRTSSSRPTDGKTAFASNYGTGPAPGHTISMIDIASQKELRRIDVAPLSPAARPRVRERQAVFHRRGGQEDRPLRSGDRQGRLAVRDRADATHMVLPTKDARTIFTSNIGVRQRVGDPAGADGTWTQTVIPVGKGPEGIDLSPNGREVWSAHSRDGGVSVIDVATKKVMQTINVGTKRSNRIKLTPDGKVRADLGSRGGRSRRPRRGHPQGDQAPAAREDAGRHPDPARRRRARSSRSTATTTSPSSISRPGPWPAVSPRGQDQTAWPGCQGRD